GGTVFIEELAAFSPMDQSKILRILENDARLRWIAATRLSISELRKKESIRSDLLDRLDIISMEIPPLRERSDDIPELVEHFLAKYSEKNRKTVSHLSNSAMDLLKAYSWPTNVRELERIVEKAVVLAAGTVLEMEDFPELIESPAKRFAEEIEGASA